MQYSIQNKINRNCYGYQPTKHLIKDIHMIITAHPFYIKTKNKRFKGHVYNHITITKKPLLN